MRGINSIQLVNDGKRWWIASVVWDTEQPDNPIPAQYLPNAPNVIPPEYLKKNSRRLEDAGYRVAWPSSLTARSPPRRRP